MVFSTLTRAIAAAMSYLADAYYDGDGRANYALSAGLYRRAAEQGDTYSQTNIGYMYENGTACRKMMGRLFCGISAARRGALW